MEVQMNGFVKFIAGAILLIIVIAEGTLWFTYWPTVMNVSNYEKAGPVIQSLLTPMVAVITVLFSYLVINTQFEKNRELEKVKQRLGEVYKRESDAYFKAWTAVSASYRLLSELQRGTLNLGSPTKIETAFSDAEPNVFVLTDDDQNAFYDYWQEVRELLAQAGKAGDGQPKKDLWAKNAPGLGALYNKIRNDFRGHYLSS